MNKTLIFYTFLFFSINLLSQEKSNNGEVDYEIILRIDKDKLTAINKNKNISDKAKEMAISTIKNSGKAKFKLFFNKNESIFKEDESLKINNRLNLVKILAGKGTFYTKRNQKKILNQKESFGEVFLINIPAVKWTLTQESKKIGKYICYKATSTKLVENKKGNRTINITAWYAPDIMASYGPKEYSGLPGLILELSEGKFFFSATKVRLNLKREVSLRIPSKGKKITLEEYNKIAKEIAIKSTRN